MPVYLQISNCKQMQKDLTGILSYVCPKTWQTLNSFKHSYLREREMQALYFKNVTFHNNFQLVVWIFEYQKYWLLRCPHLENVNLDQIKKTYANKIFSFSFCEHLHPPLESVTRLSEQSQSVLSSSWRTRCWWNICKVLRKPISRKKIVYFPLLAMRGK